MGIQQRILVVIVIMVILQVYYYYPLMPATVADHFNAEGRPNGWHSKDVFYSIYLGMLALMGMVFFFLPDRMERIPPTLLSLPNKTYWLAPERRTQTFDYLVSQMKWCGIATLMMLVFVFEFVMRANLAEKVLLPATYVLAALGAYGGFMVVWLIQFIGHFARKGTRET